MKAPAADFQLDRSSCISEQYVDQNEGVQVVPSSRLYLASDSEATSLQTTSHPTSSCLGVNRKQGTICFTVWAVLGVNWSLLPTLIAIPTCDVSMALQSKLDSANPCAALSRCWKVVAALVCWLPPAVVDAAEVRYRRDIKPVLKAKCFSCHGALKQEAGLRLDTVDLMVSGGDSGPAIVVGDAQQSELIARVAAHGEFERMPPDGEPLSPQQIRRFQAWIDSGATAPKNESPPSDPRHHWAFQPLRPVHPPKLDRPTGSAGHNHHPIDRFIRRRWAKAGIAGAPPADATILIRRMFFDLHGLPPTPDEVAVWKKRIETDPSGITALIDTLLASPRYGERWAQHWLDVVRYADTHGYEVNTPRPNAWPYRDYVITALNQDKPYDRFVAEQLAGDAFGQDAATGFLVAAAALLPGQIGKDDASIRLARQDSLDEIIIGTTATFLGMTVGCARCHDHKFDPVSQQDYYALQAFFAGVEYGQREVRDDDYAQRLAAAGQLQSKIDQMRREFEQFRPRSFSGRTVIIDDEDLQHVTLLKNKKGHGVNPEGRQRGYQDDVGDATRVGNLSRGRYTWWANHPAEDVFTWNPNVAGRFRLWISWGVHGSGVHTHDARYVLDQDGDLATSDDQTEIARADQYRFVGVTEGQTETKPMWSGLLDVGVHEFQKTTRLILRGGDTNTGITADAIVLQEETSSDARLAGSPTNRLPRLRSPVAADETIECFEPVDARFVRFTSLETINQNQHEPCIDELEVFGVGDVTSNIALASRGSRATSSGNYAGDPQHQLKHIHDGRYGNSRSWISDEHGRGWVQLEFPQVTTIDRIAWSRDRQGKFKDRLPVRYKIETSIDGSDWKVVASSSDRAWHDSPHDEIQNILRQGRTGDGEALTALARQIRQTEQQQADLRKPTMVFAGIFRDADTTFVLHRGDPEQPGAEIGPSVLPIIGNLTLGAETPEQQRRIELADWIASPENPLTARVMVNRIWQNHFGIGLVETASDFGLGGVPPTHPELLDWLSGEFIRSGWSIKHLHRMILSSRTYQQSSVWKHRDDVAVDPASVDADVKLLWRFPNRRLEAEAIRDGMLQIAGQLNLETGGPGFDFFKTRGGLTGFPPVEDFGASQLRRMIYAHKIRMEPVPVFGAFDCPDAGLPTPRRSQSTTAIQALNLFNSPFVISQADAFADRVRRDSGGSIDRQITLAFRLALGRAPREDERASVTEVVEQHGLATLCRVLLNCNEFLFVP